MQNVYEVFFPLFIFYFESPKYEIEKPDFNSESFLKFDSAHFNIKIYLC